MLGLLHFYSTIVCFVFESSVLFMPLAFWVRCVPVQSAPSTNWKCAPVRAKTARTRLRSCVTCAAWRKVSKRQEGIRYHKMGPESVTVLDSLGCQRIRVHLLSLSETQHLQQLGLGKMGQILQQDDHNAAARLTLQ